MWGLASVRIRPASPDDRHQLEDRQVHGDQQTADEAAQEHHHDRLEQRGQGVGGHVHFVFVEVGDLREHDVQRAGGFADGDHLTHHRGKHARLHQRLGDRLAFGQRGREVVVVNRHGSGAFVGRIDSGRLGIHA